MNRYCGFLLSVSLLLILCSRTLATHLPPPFKEDCIVAPYPPADERHVPSLKFNLDLPPEERWTELARQKTDEMKNLFYALSNLTFPFFGGKFIDGLDEFLPILVDTLPEPFKGEMTGISKATGIPLGEVAVLNLFYELFTICTSIVAEDKNGQLFHARNLDLGVFLGWDAKTHSWKVTEALRPLVANIEFVRNGETVFRSAGFVGYVGILTAVKPQTFTLTMNRRSEIGGSFGPIIKWLLGDRTFTWVGFLTRNVMESATSYSEAQTMLTNTPILAPAYFILGGNSSGQAAVITRGRNDSDTVTMQDGHSKWYLLQTNYDHWKKPLFIDDRRTPGNACMGSKGKNASASIQGLFSVLSSKPMLNKATVYVSLMQQSKGLIQTYLQDCSDTTCWGW